jgi:hypothetical protein
VPLVVLQKSKPSNQHVYVGRVKHLITQRCPEKTMLNIRPMWQVIIHSVLRKSDSLAYTFYNGPTAIQGIRIITFWYFNAVCVVLVTNVVSIFPLAYFAVVMLFSLRHWYNQNLLTTEEARGFEYVSPPPQVVFHCWIE